MAGPVIWDDEQPGQPPAPGVTWDAPSPPVSQPEGPPSGFQRLVSGTTESMGKILAAPGEALLQGANAVGLRSDSPEAQQGGLRAAQQAGTGAAHYIVPQTPIQAGMMAGTLGAGPLIGAGAKAAVPGLQALQRVPALGRILGGATGGEAGGQLSGVPTGAGAVEGAVGTTLGEGAGKGLGFLAGIGPGGKRALNRVDSARIGQAVEGINPALGGARTPKDFQALVETRALPALGAQKDAAMQRTEALLPPGPEAGPGWGQIRMPSLGTRELPFDLSRPAGIPLREANAETSRVGDMLYNRRPLDPRYKDQDIGQLYGRMSEELRGGLEQAGGPAARETWEGGQAAYRKGRNTFDFLRDAGGPDANGMLNVPKMQRMLQNPNTAAELQKALGPDDFKRLSDAIFRGADRSNVDRPSTGSGGMFDNLMQLLRGRNTGFNQTWRVPLTTVAPNIGAQYAGKRPQVPVPLKLQAILDLAAQRGGGQALEP